MNSDDESFAAELRRAMRAAGVTQTELADEIDASQSAVSKWLAGRTMPENTAQVIAAERALRLAPGALSRRLGWVPLEAVAVPCTVPEAVEADPGLTPAMRAALLDVYRLLRDS